MARKRKRLKRIHQFSAPTPVGLGVRRPFRPAAGSLSKAMGITTRSIQHDEIEAVGTYNLHGCCEKPGGDREAKEGKGKKGCNLSPRPGKVELIFPSRGDTVKFKTRPGPALWLCTGLRDGVILPMKDPLTARDIARKYVTCVSGKKSKVKTCIAEAKKTSSSASAIRAADRPEPTPVIVQGGQGLAGLRKPVGLSVNGEFVEGRKLPAKLHKLG